MSTHRVDVIDQLLTAMSRGDAPAVKDVLVRWRPSRDEVRAACDLRKLDMWLDAAGRGLSR